MSIGAASAEIGVSLRGALARLRVARGAKPEWRISREWRF